MSFTQNNTFDLAAVFGAISLGHDPTTKITHYQQNKYLKLMRKRYAVSYKTVLDTIVIYFKGGKRIQFNTPRLREILKLLIPYLKKEPIALVNMSRISSLLP